MTYRWHELGDGRSVFRRDTDRSPSRSDLPSPQLVRDNLDDLWHPGDGKHYSSKSAFRAATRARGSEEVGTDRQVQEKRVDHTVNEDVGRAVQMLKEGYRPQVSGGGSAGWSDAS